MIFLMNAQNEDFVIPPTHLIRGRCRLATNFYVHDDVNFYSIQMGRWWTDGGRQHLSRVATEETRRLDIAGECCVADGDEVGMAGLRGCIQLR